MSMQVAPAQLFYDFRPDDHVPADHLLRRIDRFLDLECVRTALRPFYSPIGRPRADDGGLPYGAVETRQMLMQPGAIDEVVDAPQQGREILRTGADWDTR